jgi:hypothetical protein
MNGTQTHLCPKYSMPILRHIGKGKAIPLKALTHPDGSRRLRIPDFKAIGI